MRRRLPCREESRREQLHSARKTDVEYHTRHVEALTDVVFELLKTYSCRISDHARLKRYYKRMIERLPHLQVVPAIKYAIANFVAVKLCDQELPDVVEGHFRLFPHYLSKFINDKTKKRYTERGERLRYRFIWSVNQIKRCCAEVHHDHLQISLDKHRKILTSGGMAPIALCEKAYNLGKNVGAILAKTYNPHRLFNGGNGSTTTSSKREGGTKNDLLKNQLEKQFRDEPFCLLITGKPGIGKTVLNQIIVEQMCRRLGFEPSVYTRTSNTSHWDGYHGQDFCIMDDFNQNTDMTDIKELITLVSSNHYILPMADLKDKGIKFSSKFIILNSNTRIGPYAQAFEQLGHLAGVFHKDALLRRFHRVIDIDERYNWTYTCSVGINGKMERRGLGKMTATNICDMLETDYLSHNKWGQIWFGQNANGGAINTTSTRKVFGYPVKPVAYETEPVALKEPLKVRVITKGPWEHACMESFQKELLHAINKLYPKQFGCTIGTSIEDMISDWGDEGYYLSGDYTASTDCIYQNISKALIEGLCVFIEHEPTKDYLKSGLESYVTYGNEKVKTNRGQLMGWRCSFPILCLINKIVADEVGIKRYVINGDDFLAKCSESEYKRWLETIGLVGFEKSKGKNFFHKDFGTFNSQMIFRGKHVPVHNFYLLKSDNPYSYSDSMKTFNKSRLLINKHCLKVLRTTPQSLSVPRSHGGLGYSFGEEHKIDRKVYLVKLANSQGKCKVLEDGSKIYQSVNGLNMKVMTFEGENNKSSVYLTNQAFKKGWKKIRNGLPNELKSWVEKGTLQDVPSLPEDRYLFERVPLNWDVVIRKTIDVKVSHI